MSWLRENVRSPLECSSVTDRINANVGRRHEATCGHGRCARRVVRIADRFTRSVGVSARAGPPSTPPRLVLDRVVLASCGVAGLVD